ncbi:MAG: GntR family transcriptional regulator [Sphaerochaetaceae bacterium]|jgi:GntR family transcriptional regulator
MALKHRKVFIDIQTNILSGIWPENTMIPTELELCEMYNVSRITVRRAFEDLEQLGLVRRVRGKGTFVTKGKQISEFRHGLVDHQGVKIAESVTSTILEDVLYPPGSELAKNMLPIFGRPLDGSEGICKIRLIRLVEETPFALISIFIPKSVSEKFDRSLLKENSFIEAYQKVFGEKIVTLKRSVSAIIPDEAQCELLGARKGTAHLWMKNRAFAQGEFPVAISYGLYNGNIFDFDLTFDLVDTPKLGM